MGGKQSFGPQGLFVGAVFQNSPGDGHAVKGGGAPADLIQDQKRIFGGLMENIGDLRHLHHEGGLSGGEIVTGADAGEDPIHYADMGVFGGDEAAHLGHENDQRHLPHISGFTGHVGAGDDGHPLLLFAHKGVVGDEQAVLQNLFHHRMTTLPDLNDPGLVHLRTAEIVVDCYGGKGAQRVALRHRRGGFLDAPGVVRDLLAQGGEQLIFQRHHPLGGRQDLMFQILQFLCDEPLAVYQGLLADVGFRHLLLKGIGDLNIVAEHLVIADFQGADAGFFLLLGLHLRHNALAAFQDVPQAVHFFIEAIPDDAAFPDGKGRLVTDGGGNVPADIVQRVQLGGQFGQTAVGKPGKLFLQVGQLFHGGAEGGQVPATGGAIDDAANEPFHVSKAGHSGDEFLTADGVIHQRSHGAAAAVNIRHGQEGAF